MSNQKNKEKKGWSEKVEEKLLPHEEGLEPIPLSLIIPVYNCSEVIGTTLESVEKQEYYPLEVIVVDAGSTDRTLEIVNSFASLISRIYTVANFNLPDMINRGISLASNKYLTFTFPGTYYLSEATFLSFANSAHAHDFPDLIYCGSIQREVKREPRIIQFPFDIQLLQRGQHPTTIPACWFRKDLFEKIGKFNIHLTIRPGYELFCRVVCEEGLRVQAIDRIYVDFDYGRFSYGKVLRFAAETWRVISSHFGFRKAVLWFLSINHIDMVKWLWRRFKEHVFKS